MYCCAEHFKASKAIQGNLEIKGFEGEEGTKQVVAEGVPVLGFKIFFVSFIFLLCFLLTPNLSDFWGWGSLPPKPGHEMEAELELLRDRLEALELSVAGTTQNTSHSSTNSPFAPKRLQLQKETVPDNSENSTGSTRLPPVDLPKFDGDL